MKKGSSFFVRFYIKNSTVRIKCDRITERREEYYDHDSKRML